MKKKEKKKKKKKGSRYFSEIISLKRYFKNSGTHTEKINIRVILTKNISHISWNKHYTDHDTSYVAGTVGSAAAIHLLFCLFIIGRMTENLLCHLAISKIMTLRNFFFCSVESNHLFSPSYSFSSLPLHHNSLGKKPNHQSKFSFYTVAGLTRSEKSVILWVSLSNRFLTYSLRMFI